MLEHQRYLRFISQPARSNGTMIIALVGPQDPTGSAVRAARLIGEEIEAIPFADIAPDEFYLYNEMSPTCQVNPETGKPEVMWPGAAFNHPGREHRPGPIILLGQKPDLRLEALGRTINHVARVCRVNNIVQVSALRSNCPHTVTPEARGFSTSEEMARRMGVLDTARPGQGLEDPAILAACLQGGLEYAAVASFIPHYVAVKPNPMTAHHLAEHMAGALGIRASLTESAQAAQTMRESLNRSMEADPSVRAFVEALELHWKKQDNGLDQVDPGAMAREVDQFLRTQAGNGHQE